MWTSDKLQSDKYIPHELLSVENIPPLYCVGAMGRTRSRPPRHVREVHTKKAYKTSILIKREVCTFFVEASQAAKKIPDATGQDGATTTAEMVPLSPGCRRRHLEYRAGSTDTGDRGGREGGVHAALQPRSTSRSFPSSSSR